MLVERGFGPELREGLNPEKESVKDYGVPVRRMLES